MEIPDTVNLPSPDTAPTKRQSYLMGAIQDYLRAMGEHSSSAHHILAHCKAGTNAVLDQVILCGTCQYRCSHEADDYTDVTYTEVLCVLRVMVMIEKVAFEGLASSTRYYWRENAPPSSIVTTDKGILEMNNHIAPNVY